MPLKRGSTSRMSYEIAPTDMYFFEMAVPNVAGNWRVQCTHQIHSISQSALHILLEAFHRIIWTAVNLEPPYRS